MGDRSNITPTNREFVDKRIAELKHEIVELEFRKRELEVRGHKRNEIDAIVEKAMEMAGDYRTVFKEGSVEEKRNFIRAFLSRIDLDPISGNGEARFTLLPGLKAEDLPDMTLNPNKKSPNDGDMSSLLLVAGGGFEPPTFGL